MNKSKALDTIKEALFFIVFLISCFTTNSDNLKGYFSSKGPLLIIANYIGIIVLVMIVTFINKSNINKISKISNYIVLTATVLLIFDYYVTQFSGSQFLYRVWWIGAIFVAEASLFLTTTIIKPSDYEIIYKRFWYFFTPLYLFLIFICFVRTPFSSSNSANFVLGQGTFDQLLYFIEHPKHNFEPPLMFFGNLIVFIPLPFIVKTFFKSINDRWLLAIGGITPLLIEGYQLLFKCGETDVDDLVLNWTGFLIGFIIFKVIKKRTSIS